MVQFCNSCLFRYPQLCLPINRNLDVEFSRQVSAYERCACPHFVHPAVMLAFFGFIAIQVILDQQ